MGLTSGTESFAPSITVVRLSILCAQLIELTKVIGRRPPRNPSQRLKSFESIQHFTFKIQIQSCFSWSVRMLCDTASTSIGDIDINNLHTVDIICQNILL